MRIWLVALRSVYSVRPRCRTEVGGRFILLRVAEVPIENQSGKTPTQAYGEEAIKKGRVTERVMHTTKLPLLAVRPHATEAKPVYKRTATAKWTVCLQY